MQFHVRLHFSVNNAKVCLNIQDLQIYINIFISGGLPK